MSELDASKTRVRIFTFAEGMFSRLAHDLEIDAPIASATGALDDAGDGHLEVTVRAGSLHVVGFVKKGVTDPNGPSASDRSDILERTLEAMNASEGTTIHARGDKKGEKITVELQVPTGVARAEASTREEPGAGGKVLVTRLRYSMPSLGMKPVKGPLGAFKLSDRIEIEVRAALR